MPVIKVNNLQYSLHRGPNRLGSGADADVQVEGDGVLGVQAIVELANDGQVVIRRADTSADVRVNGILLVDPAPLMHGDKVEISGTELLFADDTKSGNTSFVSSADIAAIVQKRSGPARPTSATGGRLVSLVDGKEYSVPSAGITIGRDAGAGIVVAQNDVSRKHAEISPVEGGYELRDFSVNGVYVNGTRVVKTQVLARSDVIRVGTEEFRFYADVRPAAPAAPAAPVSVPSLAVTMMGMPAGARGNNGAPPVAPPAAPKRSPAATTPAIAPAFVASAPSAAPPPARPSPALPEPVIPPEPTAPPSPVRADPRPVLATLEIANSGPTKGQVYPIHVPLVHVGRGGHNDVVLSDDSVSETHAKLQCREDGWYAVDVGSTNGTYVGGQRLSGERKLEGSPDVRFGGVKMTFRARQTAGEGPVGGTRAIASVDRSMVRPSAEPNVNIPAPAAATAAAERPSRQSIPIWVWLVVVLAIGATVAFFLLNR